MAGFGTTNSFAVMAKKIENAMKIKEESIVNQHIIDQNKIESIETNKFKIKERTEVSSALKENTKLSIEVKERIERKKSLVKEKIRNSIRKDVFLQLKRNDVIIEEKKNSVKVKQLQERLGTDETDLAKLERLHKKKLRKIKLERKNEEKEIKLRVEPMLIASHLPKISVGVCTDPQK